VEFFWKFLIVADEATAKAWPCLSSFEPFQTAKFSASRGISAGLTESAG